MTATVSTAEAITGLLALFLLVVGVLTLARVILKREDLSWARLRFGFFIERDRSSREREPGVYDWEQPPPPPGDKD